MCAKGALGRFLNVLTGRGKVGAHGARKATGFHGADGPKVREYRGGSAMLRFTLGATKRLRPSKPKCIRIRTSTSTTTSMKFLFDLLPVILFFAAFKWAGHDPATAVDLASRLLGDGVTETTAPVFLATIVTVAATFLQIVALKAKGRRIEPMLWISLAVVVVFGGLTLWLRNEIFIKWKPTILYWVFASILIYGNVSGRNFMRTLMKGQIEMPEAAWATLQNLWIGFFAVTGVINLAVAYTLPTEIWVNFKLFGLMALTLLFTIGVAFYMTKHAVEG